MRSDARTFALVLVLVLVVAGACTRGYGEAADVLDPSGSVTVPATTPPAGPSASGSGSGQIEVRTPLEGDVVASPLVVSGTGRSATGEVVVRLIGADRAELASITAPIDCGVSCRGRFRIVLAFYTAGLQPGAVQVFELGSGGSAEHLVEVPVTLTPGA